MEWVNLYVEYRLKLLLSLINVSTSVLISLFTHENWALGQERKRATCRPQAEEMGKGERKNRLQREERVSGGQVSRQKAGSHSEQHRSGLLLSCRFVVWGCLPDYWVQRFTEWGSGPQFPLKAEIGLLQHFLLVGLKKKKTVGSRSFPARRQIGWPKMPVSLLLARILPAQYGHTGCPMLTENPSGQWHPSLWLMTMGEVNLWYLLKWGRRVGCVPQMRPLPWLLREFTLNDRAVQRQRWPKVWASDSCSHIFVIAFVFPENLLGLS